VEADFVAEDGGAWEEPESIPVTSLTVGKKSTSLVMTLTPPSVNQGQVVTVETVLTSSGPPLPNKTVLLYIDGAQTDTMVTDSNGMASKGKKFDVPGDYLVQTVYPGDAVYAPSQSDEQTLGVAAGEAPPPDTHLECRNRRCVEVAGAGDDQCFADRECECGGESEPCCEGGQCGSGLACRSGLCRQPPLSVKKVATTLIAYLSGEQFVNATAELTSKDGPLKNAEVFFYVNGKISANGFTDAKGLVTIEVNSLILPNGKHRMQVKFPATILGDATYLASESNFVEFIVEGGGGPGVGRFAFPLAMGLGLLGLVLMTRRKDKRKR
jgi:hypothetical protein